MNTQITRRNVLHGTGVALALPFLESITLGQPSQKPKRRMVFVNLGLGIHRPNFFPTKSGPDYESTPYLDVLKEFRDEMTVISGTMIPDVNGGHQSERSFLTGAPQGTANFKNSISVDQLAAQQIGLETRFSFLTLSQRGDSGLSYSRNGVRIPAETRPSRLFADLFIEGRPDQKIAQIQRMKNGQSIMDMVMDKARRMEKRLGKTDREKLDQYFAAVRETEQRLVKAEAWVRRPKPKVSAKPPMDIKNGTDVIGKARLMFDMIHLALETDSTRLVTLSLPGVNAVPPIQGVSEDYHNLSHHGGDPKRLAQLKIVESTHLQVFADFLKKLDGSDEGGASLLDRTMVMYGSNLGNASNHSCGNLPIMLAGGGFKHGQHLAFENNNYPLTNLYVSMLQRLGLPIEKFASSTGTMRGLEFAKT